MVLQQTWAFKVRRVKKISTFFRFSLKLQSALTIFLKFAYVVQNSLIYHLSNCVMSTRNDWLQKTTLNANFFKFTFIEFNPWKRHLQHRLYIRDQVHDSSSVDSERYSAQQRIHPQTNHYSVYWHSENQQIKLIDTKKHYYLHFNHIFYYRYFIFIINLHNISYS